MRLEISGVRYYSTSAVLAKTEVSRQTLWRWRRGGLIPKGHRFRNGRLLFTEPEYEAILAYANHVEAEATPNDALDRQSTTSSRG
jgi:predicted site-specific integrase-resolvase